MSLKLLLEVVINFKRSIGQKITLVKFTCPRVRLGDSLYDI